MPINGRDASWEGWVDEERSRGVYASWLEWASGFPCAWMSCAIPWLSLILRIQVGHHITSRIRARTDENSSPSPRPPSQVSALAHAREMHNPALPQSTRRYITAQYRSLTALCTQSKSQHGVRTRLLSCEPSPPPRLPQIPRFTALRIAHAPQMRGMHEDGDVDDAAHSRYGLRICSGTCCVKATDIQREGQCPKD